MYSVDKKLIFFWSTFFQLPKRKKRSSRNTAAMNSNQRGNDQLDEDSVLITGEKEVINLETGTGREFCIFGL